MGFVGEYEFLSNFLWFWFVFLFSFFLVFNFLRFIFKWERDDVDLVVFGRGGNVLDCVKGVMCDLKV